ncbi:MAG: GHKL domain-containing protein [Bdellovibrionales bacterium]|nr:GHKL domain-containing protein [Bdellovibrionales bacterium]
MEHSIEHKHKIRVALLAENYQRTFTASVAFLLLNMTLMTYNFESSIVRKPMVIFGALIAGIALVRGTIAYLGLNKKISQHTGLPYIHFLTVVSSLLWGGAFSLEALHASADGLQEMVPLMLMLGLASAAPTSLIAMPRLQTLFFTAVLLGPASSYFYRISAGTLPGQLSVLPVLLLLAFFYFMSASRNVRKMLILNIKNTFKLQSEKDKLKSNAEVRLRQAEKLSSLGEMAGGIAHEINSPLTLIQGYCCQMQKLLSQEPINQTRANEVISKIENTTVRISKIVRGLKNLSRDGSADPFELGSINELIQDTLSFCNDRIRAQGITLTYSPPTQDLFFEGRATELSQVVLNILNNAVDAIEKFDDKWINISIEDKNPWIEIRLLDCGPGIPPHVVSKLFEPFFTTKGIGKGTGLGLSISATIIKNHHGQLSLDTESKNTCFVIRLPKKEPQSVAA